MMLSPFDLISSLANKFMAPNDDAQQSQTPAMMNDSAPMPAGDFIPSVGNLMTPQQMGAPSLPARASIPSINMNDFTQQQQLPSNMNAAIPAMNPTQMMPQQGGLMGGLNNPITQLGLGLLSASGPSRMPVGLGQAAAGAFGFMNKAQNDLNQNAMQRMELQARQNLMSQLMQMQPKLQSGEMTPGQAALGLLGPAGATNPALIPGMIQAGMVMNPMQRMLMQNQLKVQGDVDQKRLEAINTTGNILPGIKERLGTLRDLVNNTDSHLFGPVAETLGYNKFNSNVQQIKSTTTDLANQTRVLLQIPAGHYGQMMAQMAQEAAPGPSMNKDALLNTINSYSKMIDMADKEQRFYNQYYTNNGTLSGAESAFNDYLGQSESKPNQEASNSRPRMSLQQYMGG